jgi:hypothetical protein
MKFIGKWAFLTGLTVAVLSAFIPGYISVVMIILFILGLLVGSMNISEKNIIKFMVALITLLVLGVASINALSILGIVSTWLERILGNFIAFLSAAGLIVSIKAILETAKK